MGGSAYQKLGVVKPWPNQSDQGVYQLTKDDMDKMVFKVPSLRNIRKTAPYFHDGSTAALSQAIRNMAVHQRGVTLTDTQVKSIETWMDSLTGDPGELHHASAAAEEHVADSTAYRRVTT